VIQVLNRKKRFENPRALKKYFIGLFDHFLKLWTRFAKLAILRPTSSDNSSFLNALLG
jgi:hypothetical protein